MKPKAIRKKYRLKIAPSLLASLNVLDVSADEVVDFASSQIESLLTHKPNVKVLGGMWVLRGYYPNTPIFFKLSVMQAKNASSRASDHNPSAVQYTYYAKITHLELKPKRAWHGKFRADYTRQFMLIDSDVIQEHQTKVMENSILDETHEIKPLMETLFKKPKCMAPKGHKLFRYKKPSNGKKQAK